MVWSRSDSNENRDGTKRSTTVIATGTNVEGKLLSSGSVTVGGVFDGNIHANQITVATTGEIRGNVEADEVIIHGVVEGEIRARHIRLGATARVRADIVRDTMEMAQGGSFVGNVTHTSSVQKAAERPASTPNNAPKSDTLGLFPGLVGLTSGDTLEDEDGSPVPAT